MQKGLKQAESGDNGGGGESSGRSFYLLVWLAIVDCDYVFSEKNNETARKCGVAFAGACLPAVDIFGCGDVGIRGLCGDDCLCMLANEKLFLADDFLLSRRFLDNCSSLRSVPSDADF